MRWLCDHYELVILVSVAVLSAISRATVHRSELEGSPWRKALLTLPLLLLEVASVLRSKGSTALTKMPLTFEGRPLHNIFAEPRKPPAKKPLNKIATLSALLLSVSACAGWQAPILKSTRAVTVSVSAAHDGLSVACKPAVAECRARDCYAVGCCPGLTQCHELRHTAVRALDATMRAVVLTLLAVDVGDRPGAVRALATMLAGWAIVRDGLKEVK